MWAAAAALQHSTGSRHVLGWDRRRQEAAKASCRSPGSGSRQYNDWVGNCQRIHEEWGTATSTSNLDLDLKDALFFTLCLFTFAPGLVPQLIAPNVSFLIIPQFSPELGSQMSAASQLENRVLQVQAPHTNLLCCLSWGRSLGCSQIKKKFTL